MDPIEFASNLIAIESVSGNELEIVNFLEKTFQDLGWRVARLPVLPNRDNLLVTFGSPKVILTTHVDTVPGPTPLFTPSVRHDKLYGRGACDTKGIISAMVFAIKEALSAGNTDFGLLLVVGEEVDGCGAIAATKVLRQLNPRYIVNGEPTESRLASIQKGIIVGTITTTGRACHSGYPDRGSDANLQLIDAIKKVLELQLPEDPVYGATTINFGVLEGGIASNVVSPKARTEFTARTIGENNSLIELIRGTIPQNAALSINYSQEPLKLHTEAIPGVSEELFSAAFFSDAAHFAQTTSKCLMFGPGSILAAHTEDEHICIKELFEAISEYKSILDFLLSKDITQSE